MKIVLYGRAPGQEYSAPKGAGALHNYRWSQRPFFPRAAESSDLLCNHIQLREEDSGSGFIRNLDSNLVFHADSEALVLLCHKLLIPSVPSVGPWMPHPGPSRTALTATLSS